MIAVKAMAAGLAALSAAFNREVTPEVAEVYHGVIGPKLDASGWERAVRRALEAESFFPPPAVLLRYGLADGAPQARAAGLYERVLSHYERGERLGPREVSESYGTAAAEAFVSAGGSRAFSWCEPRDEPFRRKAWVDAWCEVAEQDPALALPPGDERRALAAGDERPEPSADEARVLLRFVAKGGRP